MLNTAVGVWIQRDHVHVSPSTLLYQYAEGRPLNVTDWNGRWIVPASCAAACAGAIGVGVIGAGFCASTDDFYECMSDYWSSLPPWHRTLTGLAASGCMACIMTYSYPFILTGYVRVCMFISTLPPLFWCVLAVVCALTRISMAASGAPDLWMAIREPCRMATRLCGATGGGAA